MKRIIVHLAVMLASSRFASAQPATPTTAETLSSSLADLHGISESLENPPADGLTDRKRVWFTIYGDLKAPLSQPDRVTTPRGTVSVKRLRHKVPKDARKAYDQALKMKNLEKAALELERAITLDPEFGDAHCDLGVAYTRLGLLSQAAAEFRRAIELLPEEAIPYSNLAWIQFATGQRAEALANVQRALRLSPDNVPARTLVAKMKKAAR